LTPFERDVRAAVYAAFRDAGAAPTPATLATTLDTTSGAVTVALRALADEHDVVLEADGASILMAHPFSSGPTDFKVSIDARRWWASCAWDGLTIVALFGGSGRLETHSPATGEPLTFDVEDGSVRGEGLIHFLVPAARFWDDICHT